MRLATRDLTRKRIARRADSVCSHDSFRIGELSASDIRYLGEFFDNYVTGGLLVTDFADALSTIFLAYLLIFGLTVSQCIVAWCPALSCLLLMRHGAVGRRLLRFRRYRCSVVRWRSSGSTAVFLGRRSRREIS